MEPILLLLLAIPLVPTLLAARVLVRAVFRESDASRYQFMEWLFPLRGRWLFYALELFIILLGLPILYLVFACLCLVLGLLLAVPFWVVTQR